MCHDIDANAILNHLRGKKKKSLKKHTIVEVH